MQTVPVTQTAPDTQLCVLLATDSGYWVRGTDIQNARKKLPRSCGEAANVYVSNDLTAKISNDSMLLYEQGTFCKFIGTIPTHGLLKKK